MGGDLNEFALEHAGALNWLGIETLSNADSLSSFHVKNWIINRWNTTGRPIWGLHVTTEWAQAATDVQNKIIGLVHDYLGDSTTTIVFIEELFSIVDRLDSTHQ